MRNTMRILIGLPLALAVWWAPVWAEDSIVVRHNGATVQMPVPVIIEEGRSLIPLRTAFEIVDMDVAWNQDSHTAVGVRGDYRIEIPIDQSFSVVNGVKTTVDVPARLINSRVYVPLRFVTENLGAQVEWDAKSKAINVYTHEMDMPVFFKEPNLKKALYEKVGKTDTQTLTRGDLFYLRNLDLSGRQLTTLDEFEYLENLEMLNLENNSIENIRPLESLTKLKTLDISDNQISSILYLKALGSLQELDARNNGISNIENISFWPEIKSVKVAGNKLDTPEELAPLFYLKNRITVDIPLDDVDEPVYNTWNLRSDVEPFRYEVSTGVYWIPAIEMGISWNKNETLQELMQNTPGGQASKIKSLYDLLQYFQHASFTIVNDDIKAADGNIQWNYTKHPFDTLLHKKGSERAIAQAAAYLLAFDYRESGNLIILYKDGSEKVLNYVQNERTFKEKNEDEDKEDVTVKVTEYGVFDIFSYMTGSSHPAATENGLKSSYEKSAGIRSNIHLTENLMDFVNAYADLSKVSAVYTVRNNGNDLSLYPYSLTPLVSTTGSRLLTLPKAAPLNKDDAAYNSLPIESYYKVLYEDSTDSLKIRYDINRTNAPEWTQ